jgi:hypothetical protein
MKKKHNKLFLMTDDEKLKFLREKIYEKIETSHTGRLMISTNLAKKVAELLGGDYDELNQIQKYIFRSQICFEQISIKDGFDKFLLY